MIYICIENKYLELTKGICYEVKKNGLYYCFVNDSGTWSSFTLEQLDLYFKKEVTK